MLLQSCRGHAPKYSASQKGHLRQVLFAARHILLDCCGRLDDSRTGEDVISWMLQASCLCSDQFTAILMCASVVVLRCLQHQQDRRVNQRQLPHQVLPVYL